MTEKVIVTTPEREAAGQVISWLTLFVVGALALSLGAALYFPARLLWSSTRHALGYFGSRRLIPYFAVGAVSVWALFGLLLAIDITPYLPPDLQRESTPAVLSFMIANLLGLALAQVFAVVRKRRALATPRRR